MNAAPQNQTEWHEKVLAAARIAVSDAIETHRRMGRSIVIWRDGQIVTVPPDQITPRPLSSEMDESSTLRLTLRANPQSSIE